MKMILIKLCQSVLATNLLNGLLWSLFFWIFLAWPVALTVGFGLIVIGYAANYRIHKEEWTLYHVCDSKDVPSILEHGFNKGKAEANLSKRAEELVTQNGKDRVCFAVDKIAPVVEMRKRLDPTMDVVILRFRGKVDKLASSEMSSGSIFNTKSHGSILEAGVDRSTVNEWIAQDKVDVLSYKSYMGTEYYLEQKAVVFLSKLWSAQSLYTMKTIHECKDVHPDLVD